MRLRGRHKYNARRVEIDGHSFMSKAEARYYGELKLRQAAGEIVGLTLQPHWLIEHNGVKVCKVILDFAYFDLAANRGRFVDVKGMDQPISRLKRKLLKAFYNIDVEIIR